MINAQLLDKLERANTVQLPRTKDLSSAPSPWTCVDGHGQCPSLRSSAVIPPRQRELLLPPLWGYGRLERRGFESESRCCLLPSMTLRQEIMEAFNTVTERFPSRRSFVVVVVFRSMTPSVIFCEKWEVKKAAATRGGAALFLLCRIASLHNIES